jgi:hypothetical protein
MKIYCIIKWFLAELAEKKFQPNEKFTNMQKQLKNQYQDLHQLSIHTMIRTFK